MPKATDDSSSIDEKEQPSLEVVQARLDEIARRLERVERLIQRISPELEEVNESAKVIREGFEFYDGIVRLMTKFTRTERLTARFGDLKKDEISWLIVKTLDQTPPLNISQLTAAVRAERGTASRRIVRERVNHLVAKGILKVVEGDDQRARLFTLAEK
ncbi:MAG: hypothetical protein K9W43_03920 [Candidatus Thorarchaeota archaeon]|nr:hypothetical protein [Candidatus Thorarchaeota archaeon]